MRASKPGTGTKPQLQEGVPSAAHFSDVEFARYLIERFGLNRGVYNTIDAWLYEQGFRDIVRRRRYIIDFLQSIVESAPYASAGREGIGIKFGKGQLIAALRSHGEREAGERQ